MRGVGNFESFRVLALSCFLFVCATCTAKSQQVTCVRGDGSFSARFRTGVEVRVSAAKKDGFAVHACDIILAWGGGQIPVASSAAVADLDTFGVDLGVGDPVASFQVQESESDCCLAYKIYSLQKPPRLLRTITGGSFFNAADTDLDGRVEIWTDDASAVQGFENLSVAELDFAPPLVLRFVKNQLFDVGAEFQSHFDDMIAKLKTQLTAEDILDFKGSDGKLLPTSSVPVEYLHVLRNVKIKILEIVWAYLYSGREENAWKALADYWPATDFERIRAAIANARQKGIRSQIDGTSSDTASRKKKHVPVFEVVARDGQTQLVPPQPILIREPLPDGAEQVSPSTERALDLIVDSAGKVRSAEQSNAKSADARLQDLALQWKFVPAFIEGRPVACRLHFGIVSRR